MKLIRKRSSWAPFVRVSSTIFFILGLVGCSTNRVSAPFSENEVIIPPLTPDPLEPVNRTVWNFNSVTNTKVIRPTGKAYRTVVRKPVRSGINNVATNLGYPRRVVNNILMGKWTGIRDESYRFVVNSTVGIGGIFDVGDRLKIPESDATFGQTFAHYGAESGSYIMLPFLGPSNVRDGIGLVFDTALDPLSYTGGGSAISTFNGLSEQTERIHRFTTTEVDSYETAKQIFSYRGKESNGHESMGKEHAASLETLSAAFVDLKDPDFFHLRKDRSVRLSTLNKSFTYSYWLQRKPAKTVYVLPGLGSHRLANQSVALAELAYEKGLNVVLISSAYHPEFIESVASLGMPGHTPSDVRDLSIALSEVHEDLEGRHGKKIGDRMVMGYSMGGFHSLALAAFEDQLRTGSKVADPIRYIAINPPVNLNHGARQLDAYYSAALEWPANKRTAHIENAFMKALNLQTNSKKLDASLDFDGIESRFLIGYLFRTALRDTIFATQARENLGILKAPIRSPRRSEVYREIMSYSFQDYLEIFVEPHYEKKGLVASATEFERVNDLRFYKKMLDQNPKVRLVHNENDFLLRKSDISWLKKVIPSRNVSLFKRGGHLGNLSAGSFQGAVEDYLND